MLVATLGILVGCARLVPGPVYSNSEQEQGDRRVGQILLSEWSFETSSFWLEGPEGLILIDTQFLPSALRKGITYAEEITGKQVKLAIILHPTPNRFNGTAFLGERGVPVVTSARIHPGRGLTGGPELLERQPVYLHTVVEAVSAVRKQGLPQRDALARAQETVTRRYPHHRYPLSLPPLLSEEWARQETGAAPSP
jgi:hypothetical protein